MLRKYEQASSSQQVKVKYISDLVRNKYRQWNDECIVFDADTGTGKTYFILQKLASYLASQNKQLLYLCNRTSLKKSLYVQVMEHECSNVYILTYQKLQDKILAGEEIEPYDFIVFDEVHYFFSDSFNEYTDIACDFFMRQSDNVCILMSATAKLFFANLRQIGKVKADNHYTVTKDYSYVNEVIFYKSESLTAWIDGIREDYPDDKVIVFCNSAKRMLEMYAVYGDSADYYCSKWSNKNAKLKEICSDEAIMYQDNGRVTFEKPILFTTKVLDNGLDFKDTNIKHIFTEIFDVDSMIQSLGRKRSLDPEDNCTFYIKNYTPQGIQNFANINNEQLRPVRLFNEDREAFIEEYGHGKKRKEWRNIKCLYPDVGNASAVQDVNAPKGFRRNDLMYAKLCYDERVIMEMLSSSYYNAVSQWLGEELYSKSITVEIAPATSKTFIQYLETVKLKFLHKPEQEALKSEFRKISPHYKTMGIRRLNGLLEDGEYPYIINSFRDKRKLLEDGTVNPYRDKTYWVVSSHNDNE